MLEDENEENVIINLLKPNPNLNNTTKGGAKEGRENVTKAVAFEILDCIADYPFDLFKIRIKSVADDLINIDILRFV